MVGAGVHHPELAAMSWIPYGVTFPRSLPVNKRRALCLPDEARQVPQVQ